MLKGLADNQRPLLTLSLLDAADEGEVTRVFQKLSSVCQQFLDWPLDFESAVQPCPQIYEHLVLFYRPNRDKAQMATGSQWTAITDFLIAGKAAQDAANQRIQLAAKSEVEPVAISGAKETVQETPMATPVNPHTDLVADVIVPDAPEEHFEPQPRGIKPGAPLASFACLAAAAPRISLRQRHRPPRWRHLGPIDPRGGPPQQRQQPGRVSPPPPDVPRGAPRGQP